MIIQLVSDDPATKDLFDFHFGPLGFDVVHYRHPVKAMDNIDELVPELVIFSAKDFPRHWKPFLRLLRNLRTKDETVFILLTPPDYPFEEAAKAMHLGVNGMMEDSFEEKDDLVKLERLFDRYAPIHDGREELRYYPKKGEAVEFIFTHPKSKEMIAGTVNDISLDGLSFAPDTPEACADLASDDRVPEATVRIGDDVTTVHCRVLRNNVRLTFLFDDPDESLRRIIRSYMQNRSSRDLEQLLSK